MRIFRGFFVVMAVLLVVAVSTVPVFASGSSDSEDTVKPLVVAMELQYPPFEMSTPDGDPAGVSVEIARALGDYLGRPVEIANTAWTGLIPSIQSGKADLVISSMSITEERKKVVDFSEPYAKSFLTLLINNDSPVQSYRDLDQDGVVLAVKSGTTGATWAGEYLTNADVRTFEDVAAIALEVSQGKADAFIYDGLTTIEQRDNFPDTTRVNLEPLPGTINYWGAAIKKGNSELKAQVDAFIDDFRSSGGFVELEKEYLSEMKAILDESGLPSFFDVES